MTALHAIMDSLIALACFAIMASLFYLAYKHQSKRISLVFTIFGALFFFGGVTHSCEVLYSLDAWRHAFTVGAIFKALTALSCLASAVVSVGCAKAALTTFTRLSVLERRVSARVTQLETQPRFDRQDDREWADTLRELNGIVQRVVAYAPPDTGKEV